MLRLARCVGFGVPGSALIPHLSSRVVKNTPCARGHGFDPCGEDSQPILSDSKLISFLRLEMLRLKPLVDILVPSRLLVDILVPSMCFFSPQCRLCQPAERGASELTYELQREVQPCQCM